MKKLIFGLATAVAMMFAVQSNAQESTFGVGVELALPMGDFGDFANFGYGASLDYEFGLTRSFALNLNAGAIFYALEGDGVSLMHIPVQVGARYYLIEQKDGLFFGVKAGMHLAMTKIDDIDLGPLGTMEGSSDSQANFSFAPEVGYFFTDNFSVALRYQIIAGKDDEVSYEDPITGTTITTKVEGKSSSYLGMRIAYNF